MFSNFYGDGIHGNGAGKECTILNPQTRSKIDKATTGNGYLFGDRKGGNFGRHGLNTFNFITATELEVIIALEIAHYGPPA